MIDPKRALNYPGAERYDRQPLLSHIFLPRSTSHTAGAPEGMLLMLSATGFRTHEQSLFHGLPYEAVHAYHNTSVHTEPGQDSLDAYMACSVLSASYTPLSVCIKKGPAALGYRTSSVLVSLHYNTEKRPRQ